MSSLRDETGAGTVLGLALIASVVLAAVAVLAVGHAAVVSQRATTAADLAALAAADVARGLAPGEPCAVAAEVARWHAAELTACTPHGEIVDVTASVAWGADLPLLDGIGVTGLTASADARAGPPPAPWEAP